MDRWNETDYTIIKHPKTAYSFVLVNLCNASLVDKKKKKKKSGMNLKTLVGNINDTLITDVSQI